MQCYDSQIFKLIFCNVLQKQVESATIFAVDKTVHLYKKIE